MQSEPSSFDTVGQHGEALPGAVSLFAVLFVAWLGVLILSGLRLTASEWLPMAAALALVTEVVIYRLR